MDGANIPTKVNLTVVIPGDGSVTGQVNTSGAPGGSFNGDNFLFVSEDGTISGWRGALGDRAEILQTGDPSNVYKGAAFATIGAHSYLLAADFRSGTIDVLKGDPDAPELAGRFEDPGLPSGFAPFNVQNLGGTIFVAYAKQGTGGEEETGAGLGFVSQFDLNGNFIGRVASEGPLDAPWGMAIAPDSFGSLGGSLLVGNFGDGRINAYDLGTSTFIDQLRDSSGNPLSIDGLWALTVGNGSRGGSADAIYFTAGPDDETNGLFGVITVVPEPSSAALMATALAIGIGVGLGRRQTSGARRGRKAIPRKP